MRLGGRQYVRTKAVRAKSPSIPRATRLHGITLIYVDYVQFWTGGKTQGWYIYFFKAGARPSLMPIKFSNRWRNLQEWTSERSIDIQKVLRPKGCYRFFAFSTRSAG